MLAPIFNNIFSTTSAIPRRLVVTVIVFFPIFVNTLRGLLQVDATKTELMRSYGASDGVVLRKVRIPNALPFFFTGLKLAASLGVIAAVVAEYFGGLQNGLGSRITSYAGATNYPQGVGLRGRLLRLRPRLLLLRARPRAPRHAVAPRPDRPFLKPPPQTPRETTMRRTTRRAVVLAGALTILAAACGSDNSGSSSSATTAARRRRPPRPRRRHRPGEAPPPPPAAN